MLIYRKLCKHGCDCMRMFQFGKCCHHFHLTCFSVSEKKLCINTRVKCTEKTGHFSCSVIMDILYLWDELNMPLIKWIHIFILHLPDALLVALFNFCMFFAARRSFLKFCLIDLEILTCFFSFSISVNVCIFAMDVWMTAQLWAAVANIKSIPVSLCPLFMWSLVHTCTICSVSSIKSSMLSFCRVIFDTSNEINAISVK